MSREGNGVRPREPPQYSVVKTVRINDYAFAFAKAPSICASMNAQ